MDARRIRCPKCGGEVDLVVSETDARRPPRLPDGAVRRVEPCGCPFAPGEFRVLTRGEAEVMV